MHRKLGIVVLFFAAGLLLAACASGGTSAPGSTPRPLRQGTLAPFLTNTATRSLTPPDPSTPTPLPSPTITPQTHVVKKGEDLFGIALRYHVSLEELKTANPTVMPNFLSIGTELTIPYPKTPIPQTPEPGQLQTPTPLPLVVGQALCWPSQDGGWWCFVPVNNPGSTPVEGVSGLVRLASADGASQLRMAAYPLLDILPPGKTLPLVAYLPPEMGAQLGPASAGPVFASAALTSALPHPEDGRYLPVEMDAAEVQIAEGGRSAEARLALRLAGSQPARRVWLLAVAYDTNGNISGVRRWEGSLAAGQQLPVRLEVYSAGGAIARVELLAEARP